MNFDVPENQRCRDVVLVVFLRSLSFWVHHFQNLSRGMELRKMCFHHVDRVLLRRQKTISLLEVATEEGE